MNILITGANGFIGRHLCKYFGKIHNVYGLSLEGGPIEGCKKEVVCNLVNMPKECLDDIRNKVDCKADVIINLASLLVSTDNAKDQQILIDNLHIAFSVIALAKAFNVKRLINFSTMSVYPNISGTFSEHSMVWTATNSDCIYGLSKFCAENLLSFYLPVNSIVHLRLAQVYGQGMRDDRIIPMMLKELKAENQITVLGKGVRVSSFIHINRLMEIVKLFLKSGASGIYNIGDESLNYYELAERLIAENGNSYSRIRCVDQGSSSEFYLDTGKLKKFIEKINYSNLE